MVPELRLCGGFKLIVAERSCCVITGSERSNSAFRVVELDVFCREGLIRRRMWDELKPIP